MMSGSDDDDDDDNEEEEEEDDGSQTPELPLEIIVCILSFLHASDRREASLVSRRWYYASQDPTSQKNVTYRFPASAAALDFVEGLSGKPGCSLTISHLDASSLSRALLHQVAVCLGPRLTGLSLPGSSLTEASLLAVLPCLSSLRRLDLTGLDSLFMSGAFLSREEHRQQVRSALCNLEELNLSDLRYLSDLTFNRLTGCTPRLRRLSLAGCHVAFEFDPYRGRPVGATGLDSSALLSLRNLRGLLALQRTTVVGLDLSRTSITPESLRTVAQVPGLVLEELCLRGCKELTDYSVEVLVKHQPGLQRLDLSGCTELTSRALLAVARTLKRLRHLNMARDWRLTEKGLAELACVSSLKSLDVSECLHVSGTELLKGLSLQPLTHRAQLTSISFKSCTYIRDAVVVSLAQLLGGSLRELDLSSCVYLTDLSVHAIATYLRGLAVLRLGRCAEITDWGLLGMTEPAKTCQPPQHTEDKGPSFTRTFGNMGFFRPPSLPFQDRPRLVTEQDLGLFRQQEQASVLALSRLQELDLSGCSKLTDSSITQVLRFPELQCVSLSLLPEISDVSLVSVAAHCPCLTSLTLIHCSGISHYGVTRAAPLLYRLQHLNLAGCNVTDRSLSALMQHCKRLKTLDVSTCKDVSMTTVDLLQSQLPFLENVHCRFVGGADPTFTL